MAPSAASSPPLTSGFAKKPSIGNNFLDKTATKWLRGKKEDDGVWPYWRIRDSLYDLTEFIEKHPGGKFWIEETQGMDITESFISSHITNSAEKLLPKYFVKHINSPRLSPFTFKENGFYMTLKRRATPILLKHKYTELWKYRRIQDSLFLGFLSAFFIAGFTNSYFSIVVSGVLLTLSANASHNYFHQKDNWRMYIFDFGSYSSRDWRVTHGLSHHVFPNTIFDYELTLGEPFTSLIPYPDKPFVSRYLIWIVFPFLSLISSYMDLTRRLIQVIIGKDKFMWPSLIIVLELFVLMAIRGSINDGLWLWIYLHMSFGLSFTCIGLTTAHFNGHTYTELDKPLTDKDWGLHQIAAINDRSLVIDSLFLTSISFGNHTLHHLFPTVDHATLPLIKDVFLETCEEFGVHFETYSWGNHVIELFKETARNTPNPNLPVSVQNCEKKRK